MPDPNAVYPLGSSRGESERLLRQAQDLAGDSAALLDRTGLRPGQRAIDLGCGPRGILELLAERVAPGGRVTGVDADPGHVAMAAEFAASRGLASVEVIAADARHTGLPAVRSGPRAHVAGQRPRRRRGDGRDGAAGPARRLGRGHGAGHRGHAVLPAVGGLRPDYRAQRRGAGRHGADPRVGRRVPGLFRQAGLADVGLEARTQMYPPGVSRRTNRLDLVRAMRPQIVQMGLASQAELEELDAIVRPHLEDPRTVVMTGLLFLVWGRKPA